MWTRWLATLALCTGAAGCQLADNAVHNLTYEAKLTTAAVEEHCNYEKLARASWETLISAEHRYEFSKYYADGYKDGFVDYLQFGGSGRPPYVPPKRFWGPYYRTPEGHRAVEDWYAGFRHGAATAQESGYRRWITLPSADANQPPQVASSAAARPGPGAAVALVNTPASPRLTPPTPLNVLPLDQLTPPSTTSIAPTARRSEPLVQLGAPRPEVVNLNWHQLHESAQDILSLGAAQADRPLLMPEIHSVGQVEAAIQIAMPPAAEVSPCPAQWPEGASRCGLTISAPVTDQDQTLINPLEQPIFGPPRTPVLGRTSTP